MDSSTQALLTDFVVNKGGRLFVTGQDIDVGLTDSGVVEEVNAAVRDGDVVRSLAL